MIELQEIFEVKYGVNLELNKLTQSDDGVNFVSRTAKNNGVSAKVKPLDNVDPVAGPEVADVAKPRSKQAKWLTVMRQTLIPNRGVACSAVAPRRPA